jgi:hypothetical protein
MQQLVDQQEMMQRRRDLRDGHKNLCQFADPKSELIPQLVMKQFVDPKSDLIAKRVMNNFADPKAYLIPQLLMKLQGNVKQLKHAP